MNGLIQELRSLVGNEGGFLHKSFIGRAVGGVVGGALGAIPGISQAIGTVRGLVGAIKGPARPVISRTRTARPSLAGAQGKEFGRQLKLGTGGPAGNGFRVGNGEFTIQPQGIVGQRGVHNGNGTARFCPDGQVWNRRLKTCLAVGSPVAAEFAESVPVMGRYGAGVIAGSEIIDRATCPRGAHLGNDGVCYNKGVISNKQRMWPTGAKPLLTGGEMNAIRTATTARGRVARAAGRLGIVAKAPRRRTPAGHKAKLVHA